MIIYVMFLSFSLQINPFNFIFIVPNLKNNINWSEYSSSFDESNYEVCLFITLKILGLLV